MTDADAAGFRSGDVDAFRALVDRWSPRLLAVALAYVDDRDVAHDVVQDAWLRAWERRGQFSGRGSLLGWLITITRNTALTRLRRARSRDAVSPGELPSPGTPAKPDVALERIAARRAVLDAIDRLPNRQRETVILRLIEGRSTREAAALLGCAEGTVKATLHRALANLTPLLEDWAP